MASRVSMEDHHITTLITVTVLRDTPDSGVRQVSSQLKQIASTIKILQVKSIILEYIWN